MRPPSRTVVVDTTILIAAVNGRSAGALAAAGEALNLATTDRVIAEARGRIEHGQKRPDLLSFADALTAQMAILPVSDLAPSISQCETALRDAVPSRNGSTSDAHVLALAWALDGDVWTNDRDFAGTGVASWSTPNLMRALAHARLTAPGETQ